MTFNRFCWYSLAFTTALFFFGFCQAECRATGDITPGTDAHGVEWVAQTVCKNGVCTQIIVPRQVGQRMPVGPHLAETVEPERFCPIRAAVHRVVQRVRGAFRR